MKKDIRTAAVMVTTITTKDGQEIGIESFLSESDLQLSPEDFLLRITTPITHRLLSSLKEASKLPIGWCADTTEYSDEQP